MVIKTDKKIAKVVKMTDYLLAGLSDIRDVTESRLKQKRK